MSFICGLGGGLPSKTLTNDAFAAMAGVDADWIRQRAGITRRFLARPGTDTVSLAAMAAREALAQAPEAASQVDLVVLASSFPGALAHASPAAILQRRLGLECAHAVDLATPFHGFIDGLQLAALALGTGAARAALVVGAEGMSACGLRDRRTSYLLSDGAGAVLLAREAGFLRLGSIRFGRRQAGALSSDGDALALSPAGASITGRCLADAVGEGQPPAVVLTQLLGEERIDRDLPPGVEIFNPYSNAGHFLAAALPLCLYRYLADRPPAPGARSLLFASSGTGTWAAAELEATGALPALGAGEESEPNDPPTLLPHAGLRERLAELVASAEPFTGISFVGLKMKPSAAAPAPSEPVARETERVIRQHLRNTDRLYRLEDRLVYGLFLRRIDVEDAWRLAGRLTRVLGDLDLAGELHWEVESTALHLANRQEQRDFATRLGEWLLS